MEERVEKQSEQSLLRKKQKQKKNNNNNNNNNKPEENLSERLYGKKSWPLCLSQKRPCKLWLAKRRLAHALISSSWPSWPGWGSLSVYTKKRCPVRRGDPSIKKGHRSNRASFLFLI